MRKIFKSESVNGLHVIEDPDNSPEGKDLAVETILQAIADIEQMTAKKREEINDLARQEAYFRELYRECEKMNLRPEKMINDV